MADVCLETLQVPAYPGAVSVVRNSVAGPQSDFALETTQVPAFPGAVTSSGVLPALPFGFAYLIDPIDRAFFIDPRDGAYLIGLA
jgi:hypothetical protein